MSDPHEPTPDIPCGQTPRTNPKTNNHMVFGIAIILLVIIWVVLMLFRWELRAQYWAHQVTHCESDADRNFYVIRLASIGDKSLNSLETLENDHRPEIRDACVTILRYCEGKPAATILIRLLADANSDVVAAAATALACRRDAASYVQQLEPELAHVGPGSWGAAVALGRIGNSEAERILLDALARPIDPDLKSQVIDSLGLLGCKAAVPLMIDALADDRTVQLPPQSQQSAQRAVASLRPQLLARGADPQAALKAASTAPTVAAVAAHWIRLIASHDAESISTQPATTRADSIRSLKQEWTRKEALNPKH